MSEFVNLKPAIAQIEADQRARGLGKELDRFNETSAKYEQAQRIYKNGDARLKQAHREWLKAVNALWPDKA